MVKAIIILLLISLTCSAVYSAPQISAPERRTLFQEPSKDIPGPEKNFTGIKVKPDSLQVAYHHEQTIAVVELGADRELFNCELLEVKTKQDKKVALLFLKPKIKRIIRISFPDMKNLMVQCQTLEPTKTHENYRRSRADDDNRTNNEAERGLGSLLNGVYPGTKWCGTGDIADTYFDLGPEENLDKCCRTHDLCPVKVAGFKTQYNITNYSLYTRSHCDCDDLFFSCLKKIKSTIADIMGNIYFNVARPVCVEDIQSSTDNKMIKRFRNGKKQY